MAEWSTKTPKYTFFIPGEENGYAAMNRKNNALGIVKLVSLIVAAIVGLATLGIIANPIDFAKRSEVVAVVTALRDSTKAENERVYQVLKSNQEALQHEMKTYHETVTKQLESIDKKLWNLNRKRGEE
jgi:hypothetical protein